MKPLKGRYTLYWQELGAVALPYERTTEPFSKCIVAVGAIISTSPDSSWPKAGVILKLLVVQAAEHGADYSPKCVTTLHRPPHLPQYRHVDARMYCPENLDQSTTEKDKRRKRCDMLSLLHSIACRWLYRSPDGPASLCMPAFSTTRPYRGLFKEGPISENWRYAPPPPPLPPSHPSPPEPAFSLTGIFRLRSGSIKPVMKTTAKTP